MSTTSTKFIAPRRPAILVILDGVGISSEKDNLLRKAHTPNFDVLFSKHPHTLLDASGASVGLPENQMGNSEVGHMIMGAGSIIKQDLVLINEKIKNYSFFNNPALIKAIKKASANQKPIHLLGLVSDGGVHSDINHLLALIELCQKHHTIPALHMITDGRDTDPQSAQTYLEIIESSVIQAGGYIATIMGRYYAMDRDKRWDRTERAWRAIVLAKGNREDTAELAIKNSYEMNHNDEFVQPVVLPKHSPLNNDDEIIFFNFRKDRPRQLTEAVGIREFTSFDRGETAIPSLTTFMPYNKEFRLPSAFDPQKPEITLAQVISNAGLEQFHCSETEKFAHVTFFLNGGRNSPFIGETRLLIPSPDVATYDLKPEMNAKQVTNAVINAINTNRYAFLVVNFPNGDMVGHTANRKAIISAIETLDVQVRRIVNAAEKHGYSVIITADHGNCETATDPNTKAPYTQHTINPVPFLIVDKQKWKLANMGGLSNVAPTILQVLGLEIPAAMQSTSLLKEVFHEHETNQSLDGAA